MSAANGVPTPGPTLADVVKDRSLLHDLPVQAIASYIVGLAAIQQELGAALTELGKEASVRQDRALTIEEAAQRLNIAPGTMKRWLRKPPYDAAVAVRSRTVVRVSKQQLEAVLKAVVKNMVPRPPRALRLGTGLLEGRNSTNDRRGR